MVLLGKCSFIVGLVIAVAGSLGFEQAWFGWILAVLGLIVGFLNVSNKESQTFLLAAIALIVSACQVAVVAASTAAAGSSSSPVLDCSA